MSDYGKMIGNYKSITYTSGGSGGKIDVTQFLNELHTMQLDMIDDAVAIKEVEGFPEANEVIAFIKGKL